MVGNTAGEVCRGHIMEGLWGHLKCPQLWNPDFILSATQILWRVLMV